MSLIIPIPSHLLSLDFVPKDSTLTTTRVVNSTDTTRAARRVVKGVFFKKIVAEVLFFLKKNEKIPRSHEKYVRSKGTEVVL